MNPVSNCFPGTFVPQLTKNPLGVEKVGQQKVFLPAKVPDRVCSFGL